MRSKVAQRILSNTSQDTKDFASKYAKSRVENKDIIHPEDIAAMVIIGVCSLVIVMIYGAFLIMI